MKVLIRSLESLKNDPRITIRKRKSNEENADIMPYEANLFKWSSRFNFSKYLNEIVQLLYPLNFERVEHCSHNHMGDNICNWHVEEVIEE